MNSRFNHPGTRVWSTVIALAIAVVALGPASPASAGVKILATRVDSSCSTELPRCGGRAAYAVTYSNGVIVTLDAKTHNSYNATGPGLTYTVYDANDAAVVTFVCNKPVVRLHSAKLLDNTLYFVVINAGPSKSPKYQFTTSAQVCKGKPLPKRQ